MDVPPAVCVRECLEKSPAERPYEVRRRWISDLFGKSAREEIGLGWPGWTVVFRFLDKRRRKRRGDCNQDGDNVSLTDAVFYLESVFSTGEKPVSRAACDFNGDGVVGASTVDALFYLQLGIQWDRHASAAPSLCYVHAGQ